MTDNPSTVPPHQDIPAALISQTADLDFIRGRISALELSYSVAKQEFERAYETAERAKLELDLSPDIQPVREAAASAASTLDSAISDRDSIAESMGRLRRREAELSASMAQFEGASLAEAKAASRASNLEAIREDSAEVRTWVARILVECRLRGMHAGDLGLLMVENLTGEHRSVGLFGSQAARDAVGAEVSRMFRDYERGVEL